MQVAKDFVAETTFWDVFINDFNLELIPKSRLMAAREMEAGAVAVHAGERYLVK